MARALVLNATYEPLSVVAARRAVVLVLSGKAELVTDTGQVWRSARLTVPVPSVVRLCQLVRVPFRRAPLTRRTVLARDGHRCQYCGRPADSVDHVIPRSRGGTHTWDARKRDRLLEETSMRLLRPPAPAPRHAWLPPAVPADWAPYLGPDAVCA